jgi:nucleoside-diphosphate-sugar epimerase
MISRALVTGGAGFIGSHVVDSLLADGVTVTVVDDLSSGDAARVAPEADLETLSIVDKDELDALVDLIKPEAIFHPIPFAVFAAAPRRTPRRGPRGRQRDHARRR